MRDDTYHDQLLYYTYTIVGEEREQAISGERRSLLRTFIISSGPREQYEKSAPASLVGDHATKIP